MDRCLLAAAALATLLLLAGCAGLGPGGGEVDEAALAEDQAYDWNTSADVTIDIAGGDYTAVYRVDNRSRLALSRFQRLNDRRPLAVEAIAFRYPNGTVVGAEAMGASQNRSALTVEFPTERGQFAYRVPMRGKELHLATAMAGSYEVVIPPDTQVRYPLLGQVRPGGYETRVEDGRVHITWAEVTDDRLTVRFYLVRDLWIFAGVVVVGTVLAVVGLAYFYVQLRAFRARRQAVDLERGE